MTLIDMILLSFPAAVLALKLGALAISVVWGLRSLSTSGTLLSGVRRQPALVPVPVPVRPRRRHR